MKSNGSRSKLVLVRRLWRNRICALCSIETLLPLARRRVHHATRTPRMVLRPLFPGYLFARFCAAASLRAVSYSRGVLRVVGGGGRPWPVDDAIIADIRERIGPEGCVELAERPFGAGDSVRITAGPLAGWSGIFDSELSDAERVVILIETLQQGRVVIPARLSGIVRSCLSRPCERLWRNGAGHR